MQQKPIPLSPSPRDRMVQCRKDKNHPKKKKKKEN